MKIYNEKPFEDYTCYKVFHRTMGRWQVCLVPLEEGKRRTLLYSKFLMSVKEGRILEKYEEVDHIDGNRKNDSLGNLEIVTRSENLKRASKRRKPTYVNLECSQCGGFFTRLKRHTHLSKKGREKTFCSKQCSYDFMRK